MNNDLMFSRKTDKWNTPQSLVDDLATVFKWDLDVCASGPNVCEIYYDEKTDALDDLILWDYFDLRWCNPPYGRGNGAWHEKAAHQPSGATVMLVPSRTDTKYWHEYVPMASQVVFIKGRLKFGNDASWIQSYQKDILKSTVTTKRLRTLVDSIGGALCDEKAQVKISGYWQLLDMEYTFSYWETSQYLKINAAPFPSAFVVFGEISDEQRAKLASYGISYR